MPSRDTSRKARLAALLPLAILGLAAPAIAQHAARGGGSVAVPHVVPSAPVAPRALPRMAPSVPATSGLQAGGTVSRAQLVPASPLVQPGTTLLSGSPPRYDDLALGHAQYADQPPPIVDVPLRNGGLGARSSQAGDSAIGLGDGSPAYYQSYPMQGEARSAPRATPEPFGSSTRIDGN